MRIIQKSKTKLVLEDYSLIYFIGGIFLILIFLVNLFLYLSGSTAQNSMNTIAVAASFIIAVMGVFLIFIGGIVIVTLDKDANLFSFQRKKLIGSNSGKYPLSSIKEIRLMKFLTTPTKRANFILVFALKDGREVPFIFEKLTWASPKREEQIRGEAKQVADFVGVPLADQI